LNKLELLDLSISRNIRLNILFTLTQPAYSIYNELDFRTLNADLIAVIEKIIKKIER